MKEDIHEPLPPHTFPLVPSFFFVTKNNLLPSDQISDETCYIWLHQDPTYT